MTESLVENRGALSETTWRPVWILKIISKAVFKKIWIISEKKLEIQERLCDGRQGKKCEGIHGEYPEPMAQWSHVHPNAHTEFY